MFFFFNDTATTEIYTLSLHDALPIYLEQAAQGHQPLGLLVEDLREHPVALQRIAAHGVLKVGEDRKSTRLNSSHQIISYAVFCLKKKKSNKQPRTRSLYCLALGHRKR